MYSPYNKGKSILPEIFIRTLKDKIYKHMILIWKNVYIYILDDIANKYNNKYHITIKMKSVDVKSSTYIDFDKLSNDRDPKFKVGDHVRISKYKNILANGTLQIGLKKFLWLKKLKILCHGKYVINDLNGEETLGLFYEKKCKKQIKHRLE